MKTKKRLQTVLNWPEPLTAMFEKDAEASGFTRTGFVAHLYALWRAKHLRSRKEAPATKKDGRPRLRDVRDVKL